MCLLESMNQYQHILINGSPRCSRVSSVFPGCAFRGPAWALGILHSARWPCFLGILVAGSVSHTSISASVPRSPGPQWAPSARPPALNRADRASVPAQGLHGSRELVVSFLKFNFGMKEWHSVHWYLISPLWDFWFFSVIIRKKFEMPLMDPLQKHIGMVSLVCRRYLCSFVFGKCLFPKELLVYDETVESEGRGVSSLWPTGKRHQKIISRVQVYLVIDRSSFSSQCCLS